MNTVILEIICPAASKSYEFVVSKRMNAGQAIAGIIEDIRICERNESMLSENIVLVTEGGEIIDPNYTVWENGIRSGDTLMIL